MIKSLVLENRFTAHQKTHMLLYIGGPILIVIYKFIISELSFKNLIAVCFFITLLVFLICVAFTKRGLLKDNSNLFKTLFFFNIAVLKKKIDLKNKTKMSVLKFKRNQKMAWFSDANPDLATSFNAFDITLLNDKHTQKHLLITAFTDENSKKVINFLSEEFSLKHEIYSPDFS